MLTGELPGKPLEPPSRKVHIDVRLDEIVLRALERKPELRYQRASEVKTCVETIVGSSGRESAQTEMEKSESRLTSSVTDQAPRFSRTAIVGACLCLPFILPVMAFAFTALFSRANQFNVLANLVLNVAPFSFLFGLPLLLVTTILGWVAVAQIRHSAGKLYGIWLAVFDGLFFPLLALDVVIGGFWYLILIVIFRDHLMIPGCALLALGAMVVADFFIIRTVWRVVNRPAGAPTSPVLKPDHFWRWFAVVVLAMISIPILISIIGLLAAIAIPNFVKARQQAQENARHAAAILVGQNISFGSTTNFYVGQTNFPNGDVIEITSVVRNETQMVVKGRYNLVSHENAQLALYITSTNNSSSPDDPEQSMQISKGSGDFELIHSHVFPGLPHVNMYPMGGGGPFAELYFGTKAEALEENKLNLNPKWTDEDAAQLAKEGWQLWQSRKLAEAEMKFKEALQLAPGDANAWNGLGWATFNAGNSSDAEKAFQKAISLEPTQPGALNGIGQIDLSRGKYDEAETWLLKAAPQAPAAWFGLARVYLLEGKFEAAETWAQKIVDSGQADETAKKMLEAAKDKKLSKDLQSIIEPLMQNQTTKSLEEQPPVVVETFPVSGAPEVTPGETEIRVRFSKEMADGSWSWSTAWENSTPEFIGHPHYESDSRTCVVKVKLEPGRSYAFWLNSDNFHNFKDRQGNAAVPYLLIFQTKPN
jgi:tetratricopeptide (TPR) repeat protein